MDPGRFREPVAIQAANRTPDGAGGYTEAWVDVVGWEVLFAEVAPLRGDEQITAQQTQAAATHRVRMWAVEGVKSTHHRIRRHRDGGVMELVAPPAYDRTRLTMELLAHESEGPA
jgi:SPP1 family predicted phage head-tail adaptor